MSSSFIYAVKHSTRFIYESPVSESVMEVRMHPMSDLNQTCHTFELLSDPPAHIMSYSDYSGNIIHNFNIPGIHQHLHIQAFSTVEIHPVKTIPNILPESTWDDILKDAENSDLWEMLTPSHFTIPTLAMHQLMEELSIDKKDDPMRLVRELNSKLFEAFAYVPESTHVDSTIDEAILNRRGVCQDFTHIMIAILRSLGIPARYVSGYLYQSREIEDRSVDGASHAWLEAWFPKIGWVGFDPTNNRLASERHISIAVGRDYRDVPPTKGVYKGGSGSTLEVAVNVSRIDALPVREEFTPEKPVVYPKPIQRSTSQIQQQQQQ